MSQFATSPETVPFWDGVQEGELRLQRCADCDKAVFFPRALCPFCHSDRLDWFTASGSGVVYTYTVVRRTWGAFADQVPYIVALVDLEEGPRMMTRIIDTDEVAIGDRAEVVFSDLGIDDGPTLPCFRKVTR
ncbi:hypothetical protein GTV32_17425 [Gordonia sp. SID5947]|uniref:Zn-ribbon domain-containing OB-fold protein n=1 Tax=Gordonia sp. SID5947 TaxID=2690315 RepID=UPI00136CE234|nr:Zn-ribbon domain-containing OB-fold protein [Gordonia sp. SID5947]MYR07967.1 hypothetical protein [Gordonia sp. SID5947]